MTEESLFDGFVASAFHGFTIDALTRFFPQLKGEFKYNSWDVLVVWGNLTTGM